MTTETNLRSQRYFEQAAGFWAQIYEQTDVYSLVHQERRKLVVQMIEQLALPKGARVLEVGCGAGHLTVHLAGCGFQVSAVDAANSMVAATRERVRASGCVGELPVEVANAADLPFQTAAFDFVVAIGVLPWIDAVAPSLAEMARVVKPGGTVLVTMDNRWALHRVLDPRLCPPVVWLKRWGMALLSSGGLVAPKARAQTLSVRAFDRELTAAGLEKRLGTTLGFGPFTFWNRPLVSEQTGAALHRHLQRAADAGMHMLKAQGGQYVVLAERPKKEGTIV